MELYGQVNRTGSDEEVLGRYSAKKRNADCKIAVDFSKG